MSVKFQLMTTEIWRYSFSALLLFWLFVDPLAQTSEPYDWQNAPIGGGGYITGMKIHPLDATKRYYRTDVGGAYRWDEGEGRMKQMIYLDNRNLYSVAGIALHPTDVDTVYLAVGRNCNTSENAILRSTNGGLDFEIVDIPGGVPFWFAANGGRECLAGADKDRQGSPLAINPLNTNELYIGSRSEGLFILNLKTHELNHVPASSIPYNSDQLSIRSVVFHPSQPIVYVAYAGHGVYVGNTTTLAFVNYGMASQTELQDAIDISMSKDADYMLVACKTQGILKATDLTGTLNWTVLRGLNSADDEGYLTADCSPHDNDVAVTIVADWNHIDEFQVTTDAGATWNQIAGSVAMADNIFPWRDEAFASHVSQIAFDPSDNKKMHYTSWFSTFACNNFNLAGPNSWHNLNAKGHEEIVPTDLVAFPVNSEGNFLMAGSGDHSGFLFDDDITNPDSFATFHVAERASTSVSPLKKSASMDFCEKQSDHLVVCLTEEWNTSKAGILTSNDGGKIWQLQTGYDMNLYNKAIVAMSSNDPDNIIALNNSSMMYTLDGNNFHTSSGTNSSTPSCAIPYNFSCKGATNVSGTNINDNVFGAYRNITADRTYECVFYFYDWDGDFSVSTDGGVNWCIVNDNTLPASSSIWNRTRLISIPGVAHAGHLWININEDLWHTKDAGETWINYSVTQSVDAVKALSFGKGLNTAYEALYIYGSIDGVVGDFFYRSDDAGINWIKINDHAEKESWGDNKIIAGDRNIAGRLYASASGQGVIFGDSESIPCDNLEKIIGGEFDQINNPTIPNWVQSQINGAIMEGTINNWTKAVLDVELPGINNYDLQLWQDDLTMETDKVYLIQTNLRSDVDRPVTIKLRNKTNGTTYLEHDVSVTTNAQEFAFLFQPNVDDSDLRLTLMVGGDPTTVYVDHIRFKEYCVEDLAALSCLDFIRLEDYNLLISSDYHAAVQIISSSQILGNSSVDFRAGNEIALEPNFEIFFGSTFSAQIEGCP